MFPAAIHGVEETNATISLHRNRRSCITMQSIAIALKFMQNNRTLKLAATPYDLKPHRGVLSYAII